MVYEVIFYSTPRGDSPIDEFLDSLMLKELAKVEAFIDLLSKEGPTLLRPYTDTVKGKIRELRISFAKNQYRILYFYFLKDYIILVHAFKKKTDKILPLDIEQAIRNMRDFMQRYKRGEIKL